MVNDNNCQWRGGGKIDERGRWWKRRERKKKGGGKERGEDKKIEWGEGKEINWM